MASCSLALSAFWSRASDGLLSPAMLDLRVEHRVVSSREVAGEVSVRDNVVLHGRLVDGIRELYVWQLEVAHVENGTFELRNLLKRLAFQVLDDEAGSFRAGSDVVVETSPLSVLVWDAGIQCVVVRNDGNGEGNV